MSQLSRFLQNPEKAIADAKSELNKEGFDSRLDELISNPNYNPKHVCSNYWGYHAISIFCKTCSLRKNAYLCIPCFLNGNHEGHDYEIRQCYFQSCSCGNPDRIKPEGFCKMHQSISENPQIEDFGPKLSEKIIQILSEAVQSLTYLGTFNPNGFRLVIEFLSLISKKSDSLRRCLAIALCEKNNLTQLLNDSSVFDQKSITLLHSIFLSLFSDSYFSKRFDRAMSNILLPFLIKSIHLPIKKSNILSIWQAPYFSIYRYFYMSFKSYSFPDLKLFDDVDDGKCIEKITRNYEYSVLTFLQVFGNRQMSKVLLKKIFSYTDHLLECTNDSVLKSIFYYLNVLCNKLEFGYSFTREFGDKKDDLHKSYFKLVSCLHNTYKIVIPRLSSSHQFFPYWYDKLLNVYKPNEYFKSTLDKDICIFPVFFNEMAAYELIFKNKSSPSSVIFENFKNSGISVDNFIFLASLTLLRWHSFVNQANLGFFARNDDGVLVMVSIYYHTRYITKYFANLFSLLQVYAGIFSNKEVYMNLILCIFGIIQFNPVVTNDENNSNVHESYELNESEHQELIFSTIYFIVCIIFDRVLLTSNDDELLKYLLISILNEKPRGIDVIKKLLPRRLQSKKNFYEILNSISICISHSFYNLYKLKPGISKNVIQPWIMPSEILKIDSFAIPDWIDEPYDLNLHDLLFTKNLFALEYRILNDYSNKISTNSNSVKYVLILLVHTHRLLKSKSQQPVQTAQNEHQTDTESNPIQPTENEHQTDSNPIQQTENENKIENKDANSMNELVLIIPDHFNEFIQIKISYMNRKYQSVIDILQLIGKIAFPVLEELGIPIQSETTISKKVTQVNKNEKIKNLRKSILDQFQQQRNKFVDSLKQSTRQHQFNPKNNQLYNEMQPIQNELINQNLLFDEMHHESDDFTRDYSIDDYDCQLDSEIDKITCSICQETKNNLVLCYPLIFHRTAIPNFLLSGKFKSTYLGRICNHPIHLECIPNPQNVYCCAIDRLESNYFLPKLSSGFEYKISNAPLLKNEDKFSIYKLEMGFILMLYPKMTESFNPASIIAGNIIAFELRNRLACDKLDDFVFKIFMSNFFIGSWHYIRMTQTDHPCHIDHEIDDSNIPKLVPINQKNHFECFVWELLNSKSPNVEFNLLVKKYSSLVSDKKLFVFLRRCALLFQTAFNSINFQSLLTYESLIKMFDLEMRDVDVKLEFPMNHLQKLPKRFVEFYAPPLNAHKAERWFDGLCLLTGKNVPPAMNKELADHLSSVGGTSIVLTFYPHLIPKIALINESLEFDFRFFPVYFNSHGDECYTVSDELFLSEEKIRKVLDICLSGNLFRRIRKS